MRLKVLKVVGGNLISPFNDYKYGKMKDVIGKEMTCKDFDNSNKECSNGFYSTEVEGLIYSLNQNEANRVFEVEVSGKSKVFNEYKQRFERQTIVRMLESEEVKELVKEQSDKMDWDYYHACYPINPFEIEFNGDLDKANELLKQWASVWASVRDSVGASVRASVCASVVASVRHSVVDSVEASVGDSVWDSVYYYTSSLFPNIKKWQYIDHEEGINPFQPCIDLWHRGLVPVKVQGEWKLFDKNGEVGEVYDMFEEFEDYEIKEIALILEVLRPTVAIEKLSKKVSAELNRRFIASLHKELQEKRIGV